MEAEAAGEWPEVESEFLLQKVGPGPKPLVEEGNSPRKQRVYTLLNGDL
jgi:hypothetical protein